MLGYKQSLGKAMLGHQMPLGKLRIGSKMPLMVRSKMVQMGEPIVKKVSNTLERNVLKR
jgi:hypothetical protein